MFGAMTMILGLLRDSFVDGLEERLSTVYVTSHWKITMFYKQRAKSMHKQDCKICLQFQCSLFHPKLSVHKTQYHVLTLFLFCLTGLD